MVPNVETHVCGYHNIILDSKLLILSCLILCLVLGKLKGKENREKNVRKEKCKKYL